MRAIGKRLVVKMADPLEKINGIFVPESAQGVMKNLAHVMSIGGQCDIDVKAGDHILVRGARSIPNLPYDVIEEADVICVVSDQDIKDIKAGKYMAETEAEAVQQ